MFASAVTGRPTERDAMMLFRSGMSNQTAKPDVDHGQLRRANMDKDRVVGAAHQVKGVVKEGIGKITGDAKTQAEGAAEKQQARYKTRLEAPKMPSVIPLRSNRNRHAMKTIIPAAVFAICASTAAFRPAARANHRRSCGDLHPAARRHHCDQILQAEYV
jgi:uncharacterized protein YjbJ (UPF0337 family)